MDSEPPLSHQVCSLGVFVLATVNGVPFAIVLLILLLICSALISGSEVAYFSLTPQELHDLRNDGSRNSARILGLRSNAGKLLATILVANNFVNIAIILVSNYISLTALPDNTYAQWSVAMQDWPLVSAMSLQARANAINFVITTVLVTFLLVLFGEVAPKIYAKMNNISLARFMSGPLVVLSSILSPSSNLLVGWSEWIERRLGSRSGGFLPTDKDEIDKAIDLAVSQGDGKDSKLEAGILKSIIKFNDVPVKQIMRSRVDVIAADVTLSYTELIDLINSSGYSRIPVYEDDFDNIVGILYVKDLISIRDRGPDFKWQDIVRRQVMYAPESKKINELLKSFQTERVHIAIVVDEYGGSSGIVTLEDVMEEVIGEIKDEFDVFREGEFVRIDESTFLFDGKMLINDACRILDIEVSELDSARGDADSLAGLLLEINGEIPSKGAEVTIGPVRLRVLSVSPRRIEKLQVKVLR